MHEGKVDPATVNLELDKREASSPLFVFQVALAGGTPVKLFDRTVRLIQSDALPAYHLRNFTHWLGEARVSDAQVLTFLELLMPHAQAGDVQCCDAAIDLLGARLYAGRLDALLRNDSHIFWDALTAFAVNPGAEVYGWQQLMLAAASSSPVRAIHMAATAMVGDKFALSDDASNLLCNLAGQYPTEVMDEVGKLMLDDNLNWHFFLSKYPVFAALPASAVTNWLEHAGVNGAQKIARHLPMPYVDASRNPVVPELTGFVLSRFEDDDRTFQEFCAGVHSLQTYTGDIAGTHEAEAQLGRAFLNHPLRRIREWGNIEYERGRANAQRFREWNDEADL
jgi:hypothetical protein